MKIAYDIFRCVVFLGVVWMVVRQLYIETKRAYGSDDKDKEEKNERR